MMIHGEARLSDLAGKRFQWRSPGLLRQCIVTQPGTERKGKSRPRSRQFRFTTVAIIATGSNHEALDDSWDQPGHDALNREPV